MWRKVSILLLLLTFTAAASAQDGNFDIQLVNDTNIRLFPGASSNIALKLVNNAGEDQQVSLKIDKPQGWKCFSGLSDIRIPNSNSTIKILSFNIPSNTLAGDYFINVDACDIQGKKIGGIRFPVSIKPKYELNSEVIHGPDYVFAGDTFSVQFMVQNLSNIKAEIDVLLKGNGNDEKMKFSLTPDSTVFITRKMRTEKGIISHKSKNVSLAASLVSMPEVSVSTSHFYKLIPSGDVKFDPYNRFPVQFSTSFVTDNSQGKRAYALVAEVTGHGFLDEKQTKAINFHLQGPDRSGKPIYGISDEYFIEFLTPKSKFLLGDNTYSLSLLTEYSRYGRGGGAEHSFRNFMIGSFVVFPRFYPNIKREVSVYAGYRLSNRLCLNVGYLNKLGNTGEVNHMITLNGTGSPFKWANLAWEYSLGSVGIEIKQAARFEANINYKVISILYNYTMAEKGYPGYYSDSRSMQANVNARLSGKISIVANYSDLHQNMALDTLYGNAPFSKNMFFSFNFRFMKDGGLSASYNFRDRQDRMEPKKFYYNEHSMRLNLDKRFGNFGCTVMGEYGNTENFLMPEEQRLNRMYHGQITMNYQTSRKLNINGFVSYRKSNRYSINEENNWLYGATMNTSIGQKLTLSLSYQNSYDVEEYYRERSIMQAALTYTPGKNNCFEISSRYSLAKNSLDKKEFAFMVKYIRTFNIPVSKKKNIGKLSGMVLNKGVKNIEGIVMMIGSDQTVTDKNGSYCFHMLPAGSYYLTIDYSKAGMNVIPETPSPFRVEILPGKETKFDIGLTQASRITGEIVIVKEVSEDNKTYAGIKDQLGKLLIEVKKEGEIFRTLTGEDGKFSFESIRPGQWTVKVYERGIPKEYELVTDLFHLVLDAGHTEHIEVKIKEKRRLIKFQKSK